MPKFIGRWDVPAGISLREATSEPAPKPAQEYAHFWNLSQGKLFCVFEAPSEEALREAFRSMPPAELYRVEYEYDRVTSEFRRA